MRYLRLADDFILDRIFQPISDRMGNIAKPRDIALFLLMGSMFINLVVFILEYMRTRSIERLGLTLTVIGGPMMYFMSSRSPITTSPLGNPLRVMWIYVVMRLLLAIAVPERLLWAVIEPTLFTVGIAFSHTLFWAYCCFEACNTNPPRQWRVWQGSRLGRVSRVPS